MSILNPEPGEFGKRLQENKAKDEQTKAKEGPSLLKTLSQKDVNLLTEAEWAELKAQGISPVAQGNVVQQGKMTASEVLSRKQAAENNLRQAAGLPPKPYPDPGVIPVPLPAAAPAFGCSDHALNPGHVCCQCGEYVDKYGNTCSNEQYCQYPECSCIVQGNFCARKLQERKDVP